VTNTVLELLQFLRKGTWVISRVFGGVRGRCPLGLRSCCGWQIESAVELPPPGGRF